MAYSCVGNMSPADWVEIKKLCASLRRDMNRKIDEVETRLENEINSLSQGDIQTIKNQLQALTIQVNTLVAGQEIQDQRIDSLENRCANLEITTSEVLEAYNGA